MPSLLAACLPGPWVSGLSGQGHRLGMRFHTAMNRYPSTLKSEKMQHLIYRSKDTSFLPFFFLGRKKKKEHRAALGRCRRYSRLVCTIPFQGTATLVLGCKDPCSSPRQKESIHSLIGKAAIRQHRTVIFVIFVTVLAFPTPFLFKRKKKRKRGQNWFV